MDILKTGKDLRRLNDIVNILIKYGFGDIIRRMGMAESLEKAGKLIRYQMPDEFLSLEPPQRARRALEEMGPTFIKFGQILATRVDLFPPEWIHEFEKLQDEAPVLPLSDLTPQLERSLGQPLDAVFIRIDDKPLGSASMAQVHRARTRKGEDVVLKIRKPDIRDKIESDLRLVAHLARLAQSQSQELRRYKPVSIVKEFEKSLLRELDFTIECKNAERIAENLKSFNFVKIPRVYWDYCSEDLNVQEFVAGIPAKNIAEIERQGLDRKLIAHRGAKLVWKSMLIDGFFHADPHPGNFLILPRNRIAVLDFGMVGKLSTTRREQLMKLTRSIVLQDAPSAASVILEWCDDSVDFDALVSEGEDFIQQYHGVPLSQLNIPQMIADVTELLRAYDIQLPPDIAMFSKACMTLEGFGRLINPDFDLMEEAEPLIRQWGMDRYKPTRLVKKLSVRAMNLVDRLYEEPRPEPAARPQTSSAPSTWDRQQVERLARRFEHQRFRQTQILVGCSFLIASAILSVAPAASHWFGFTILGLLGLIGSTLSIHWLLFLYWWSKRSGDI